MTPADEMQEIVSRFIAENPSWVIDGSHFRKIGTITIDAATDIICAYAMDSPWGFSICQTSDTSGLDPPFWRYYPRVILRTFLRWIGLEGPCAPGCVETFCEFYAADGMIRGTWHGHTKYRTRFEQFVGGDSRLKRFRGWWYLKPLWEWLAGVAASHNNTPT